MVHRNLDWIEDLEIEYDASCFDIDPFQAMPGGVGSIWPFFKGKLVELPYTLPQDHTLFVALRDLSITTWKKKTEFLRKWSGMAMFLTHPDYLNTPSRLGLYERMLVHLREFNDAWSALPHEVADWWRERQASTVDESTLKVSGPASIRGRVTNYTELFGPLI